MARVHLEAAVVEAVLGFYKERYAGEEGRKRLRAAIHEGVGSECGEVESAKQRVQGELAEIDTKVTKLLDNITPANRDFVDTRLTELGGQKDDLKRREQELDELLLGKIEEGEVYDDVHSVLATLEGTLHDGAPEQRIRASRTCVQRVVVDQPDGPVRIELREVPSAEFGSTTGLVVKL